ncbi:MAG: hypothetical protein IPO47_19570 [Bacteroidetes bacterium]|nr:hypothetical protein [Bacteroidota bacterium]
MSSVIPNTYVTIFDNILPVKFVDDYEVVDTLSYLHLYDDNFALIATEEQIPIAHTLVLIIHMFVFVKMISLSQMDFTF